MLNIPLIFILIFIMASLFFITTLLLVMLFIKVKKQNRKNLEIRSLAVILVNSQSKDDAYNVAEKIYNLAG